MKSDKFIFNWILNNKLAIGSAPLDEKNIQLLREKGITCILNLCNAYEYKINESLIKEFQYLNYPLLDHKSNKNIEPQDIRKCLKFIEENIQLNKIFVHCLASVERSPIICLAWLMKYNSLTFEEAYIYLSQVHKNTSPLNRQLKVVLESID